jgi:hypothetical protein
MKINQIVIGRDLRRLECKNIIDVAFQKVLSDNRSFQIHLVMEVDHNFIKMFTGSCICVSQATHMYKNTSKNIEWKPSFP